MPMLRPPARPSKRIAMSSSASRRGCRAVLQASAAVLDQPLAQMLVSLSERHRPETAMPQGQAILLWLQHNMPHTAQKVLEQMRSHTLA